MDLCSACGVELGQVKCIRGCDRWCCLACWGPMLDHSNCPACRAPGDLTPMQRAQLQAQPFIDLYPPVPNTVQPLLVEGIDFKFVEPTMSNTRDRTQYDRRVLDPDGLQPVAIDTETFLIGPGAIAPKLVCATLASREIHGPISTFLWGNHGDDVEGHLKQLLEDKTRLLVFHNAAFDLTVIAHSYPRLLPLIFQAIEDMRVDDTLLREKLLNLSTHGQLELRKLPTGDAEQIRYNLAVLVLKYLGRDRSAEKEGDDIWRLNYCSLDGMCASAYPDDAAAYAKQDASDTLEVWELQEARVRAGDGTTNTSRFQAGVDFALRMMTVHGVGTDQVEVERITKQLEEMLQESKLQLLIDAGIMRPAEPARPHARQAKKVKVLLETLGALDPLDVRKELEAEGIKFVEGAESSICREKLQAKVIEICAKHDIKVKETDGGQPATDDDFLEQIRGDDPILAQYVYRQSVQKLVSTYVPALRGNLIIHPNYDVLKETLRTSSYGNSRNRKALYPSLNIQNQPKELGGMNVRHCFVPREGTVFWDVDYEALELACVGQTTHDLLGYSQHLERYNQGVDLHANLASRLVTRVGRGKEADDFRKVLTGRTDLLERFSAFKLGNEAERKFFKHWRSFAKPVGLGFPGGLGAKKMVTFARATYEVTMTEEEARESKDEWLDTYPEMRDYFRWVDAQRDERNPEIYSDEETGEVIKGLWYESPMGAIRRGATYCAVANGKAMQTPGAEGAKLALFKVLRACFDESEKSVLFGCRPVAFVHDQIIGETTVWREDWSEEENLKLWSDQCFEVSRIMVECMEAVLTKVKMRTEPLLTTIWSKEAVPTWREISGEKILYPWERKVDEDHSPQRTAA